MSKKLFKKIRSQKWKDQDGSFQITIISSKKAKKIQLYAYIIFMICLFILSYLAGDNDYLSASTAWNIFYALATVMVIITYLYVYTYPKEERKEFWLTHGITVGFYAILNIYFVFFR